ncbi:MAG: hydrophobe/amphiphile efflux-1 family RND transporter, partial [Gammaproteobacteria bacterium]
MFSRFFINRPIFAMVISIFIVIAGLAAMRGLPIAQYPEIAPPQVIVAATYPGASAEVLEKTVAAPLETQINGVEGMLYMNSTSASNGRVELYVTFEIGTNIDQAVINVSNRVKQAEARLPLEVRRQGIQVEKSSSSFLQVLAFTSPDGRYDDLYTSNYVTLNVLDVIKRIPGTTNVQIFGAKDYAMRVWLKPDRLAQLKLTTGDITRAIFEQNAQYAVGRVGQPPTLSGQELALTVNTKGRLASAAEFENIVVRANADGSLLKLKDVARIELGSRDYDFIGRLNGKPATLVGIFLKPGANALDVAKEVKKTLGELSTRFPDGLTVDIPYDTTDFVQVSIREVLKTLGEAMVLVFLVVYLFLQNWRATLIPTMAVPVSLIGTFAGLHLLGYSINTLTLFGMVLSIGIVVDDAIVVLENVERIMHEEKIAAKSAAIQAMREVTGPVIAIVLVLCAVFVPVGFLGGLTGQLYKQFAITIAVSVTISGFVALTLTPALCALLLKPGHTEPAAFFRGFNRLFDKATERFGAAVAAIIRRWALALLCAGGVLLMLGGLVKTVPTALIPPEDQGYYLATVQLPNAASLSRTKQVAAQAGDAAKGFEGNADVVVLSGYDILTGNLKTSAATVFSVMKPWEERGVALNIRNAIYDFMHGTQGNR